jgi:tetratricopeptide (TPR) repeat protein
MRQYGYLMAMILVLTSCAGDEPPGGDADGSEDSGAATRVAEESGSPLGTVQVANTCVDEAAIHLERGLALLHNMTYEESEAAFATATSVDPQCAMGYWGRAMTIVHPLWSDPPTDAEFEEGSALIEQARGLASSDREGAFIDALGAYYDVGRGDSERPNLQAFELGWKAYHEAYPDDPEGALLYALSQLATVDPADKTFGKQREAGALAERVLAEVPDHPGAHHYIIHAYDNPALSAQAEDVARSYSDVAPDIPHALHMPTHTFTRLGLWQESIDWNRRSADAALQRPVGDQTSLHYFHALDYLAYAFLQGAEDEKALAVLREMEAIEPPYQAHIASAYTFAAVPARLALERHRWADAADLEPRVPADYPWETAAATEAITHFARALGAARSGRFEESRTSLNTLAGFQEEVAAASPYWGTQVEVQRLSALAWLQFEEGSREEGLATMQSAADLEATTEKHPVTPGEVLPARELLGDMLMELGQHERALAEYEAALDRSPNRFNSLYGAGRAAELDGQEGTAAEYYQALIEVTQNADTERDRLRHARDYAAASGSAGL